MNSVGVRTCLCPRWLCSLCFTLDLPPAVCFFSILFRLMCPPSSSSSCPLSFPTYLFSIIPASFPITPSFPFPSIPLACIHVNPPHIWRDRLFFRSGTSWEERVKESAVKRNKSITLIKKKNKLSINNDGRWLTQNLELNQSRSEQSRSGVNYNSKCPYESDSDGKKSCLAQQTA